MMLGETARFMVVIPHAAHLIGPEPLDPPYYVRHRIETVHRIRMTSRVDAIALARMIDEDYEAAAIWAKYAAEELTHDRLFLRDLRRHGYTEQAVLSIPPFRATFALVRYLTRQIHDIGSIAAVAYSIYAEWSSSRYSTMVVSKAGQSFGDDHVRGSRAHLGIDENEDHYERMLEVASRLLPRHRRDVLNGLIEAIGMLLRDYYRELGAPAAPILRRQLD
jgi:hypothetical protein